MIKAYLVQHTHWDREWYFTTEDAKVLSDQVFTEALTELEKNKNVNFYLDGQTSIVDEYVELNPEMLPLIKKLNKEKRLFIGPWFTQTDALLVDAESIFRNLIIGINDTIDKYEKPSMLGYLPDTFGFNAQMPTLLVHAGIDNILFWRGTDFEKLVQSPYFKWNGLGEKEIIGINFPFGYMTGLLTEDALSNPKEFVTNKLDPSIKFLSDNGNHDTILIPSGIDQKNMVMNFDKTIDEINKMSNYENYVGDYEFFVDQLRQKDYLPKYKGELRMPKYSRAHRTIGSVRTDLKLNNFYLEQVLLRRIEPLMVIAKDIGINISLGLLKRLWKKVLENQAHDSIGGCVSDSVAKDIYHRIKEAKEIAEGIENLIVKKIADQLELAHNEVLVFNTDPYSYSGTKVVHITSRTKNIKFESSATNILVEEKYYPERHNVQKLVASGFDYITEPAYYELDIMIDVDLPPMGYSVVTFKEDAEPLIEEKIVEENSINNEFYIITFEKNVLILETQNGNKYENFVYLENQANDGDTYDFSPLLNDSPIKLTFETAKVAKLPDTDTLILSGKKALPKDLADRTNNEPDTELVKYEVHLNLRKDSQLIEGKIFIDNQVLSHRTRLVLNTKDSSEKSISKIQNGFIEKQPQSIEENWAEKYSEKPVNVEIFDKSVSVENSKETVTVFADGLKEFERVSDKLYITLFATTGQLGKPDIAWRPGRASGDTTNEGHIMMSTPMAQEIGMYEVSFAILVEDGKINEEKISKIEFQRLAQSISYQRQNLNKFVHRLDNKIWPTNNEILVKRSYSLFELPENLLVSAIYPSFKSSTPNTYVIRLANPTSQKISIESNILNNFEVVDAIEKPVKQCRDIAPYDYVTIKSKLK
ncbi:glycoside hydrolase family 38 C-terminal domain-containing protein [Pisciglobus halotolerans]|uniref:Alpha-mannosidase n=1 Tax=Pisciglobus halotolerans TaxID=745365 RepID=A0A1I3B0M8_9LACT|nr:glycoside hydrolase family 38 C-terminal domain-containing protein [Pisciglobus halotolerans]SFH55231.1 Alpha-mannosidase [Pisciglobus halotolerans]